MPATRNQTTNLGKEHISVAGMLMEFHTCGNCGVTWGMPVAFLKARRQDGVDWMCPNGHEWHWDPGETKAEKLERQLAQEQERAGRLVARLDQTKAELQGTKAAKTRFKNERDQLRRHGAAGVCPHPDCHRHFTNLERHVKSQHPELLEQVRDGGDA